MGIAGAFTSLFMMGVVPPLMYADGIENGWRHTCACAARARCCFPRPPALPSASPHTHLAAHATG